MGAYDDLTNEQLFDLAKRTLAAAAAEAPGSVERAVKFAAYDSVVQEAKRRAVREVNQKYGLPDIDVAG